MSRYVFAALLCGLLSPLAIANIMIIRVVVESGPADAVKPLDAPPSVDPAPPVDPASPEAGATPTPQPETHAAPPIGDPARSIVVMVPIFGKHDEKRVFDKTKGRSELNPDWNTIRHKYGHTFLYTDGHTVY